MNKEQFGYKLKLIAEILFTGLFFLSALVGKVFMSDIISTWVFIGIGAIVFTAFTFFSRKCDDLTDEYSEKVMAKVNSKIVSLFCDVIIFVVIFFEGSETVKYTKNIDISLILVSILLVICILRLGLYLYYDKKGLYNI